MLYKAYLLLRGVSMRSLIKTKASSAQIEKALYLNSVRMKQLTIRLVELGVPLRYILMPYVDTVLLSDATEPYYFGERMLIAGDSVTELREWMRKLTQEEALLLSGIRSDFAANIQQLNRLLTQRAESTALVRARLPEITDSAIQPQLVQYTFAVGRLTALPQYATECRRTARAVLAFGDILGRVVRKAGGKILRCAENEFICCWPQEEPSDIPPILQQTYVTQLAPMLGGEMQMKRMVYAQKETVFDVPITE